ncbi:MAG TPA: YIP1 family protein [Gemmatimonadaceae bacterium]|nr:YIP1 family protein [Gemmatimonadaceae bacterium]
MDERNSQSAGDALTPQDPATIWEDFIDIFYAPVQVFARRINGNYWLPLFFVTVVVGILNFANRNTLRPVFDAEYDRSAAVAMTKNPQLTPQMMEQGKAVTRTVAQVGATVGVPILIVLTALVVWVVGMVMDARIAWGSAMVIATYAVFPRILQAVLVSVQGLLMDPSKITSRFSIAIGPSRFLDPDTASPVMGALLDHFDLFVLWGVALLAIGLMVMGRMPRAKAWAAGAVIWVVTLLPTLLGALRQM